MIDSHLLSLFFEPIGVLVDACPAVWVLRGLNPENKKNRGIQQLTIFSYLHLIQLLFISVSVGPTETTCMRAGLVSFQTHSVVAPDEEQSNLE